MSDNTLSGCRAGGAIGVCHDPEPPSRRSPAARVSPRSLPELPDTDHALVARAVKAATPGGPRLLLAMHVAAPAELIQTPLVNRLDAFYESANPTFHTHEGDVRVALPFRMATDPRVASSRDPLAEPYARIERRVQGNWKELVAVAARAGIGPEETARLPMGRVAPGTIERVTQGLIDTGKLPPGATVDLGARIRTMMAHYGVGIDCAGYVQQAFLASRGISRAQAGFRPMMFENLSGLSGRGYRRVAPADIAAGDLFIFCAPDRHQVGHTAIVHAARGATAEEARKLATYAHTFGLVDPTRLERIEVDTSWGSGADPLNGGVRRTVFWHDETSDRWMSQATGAWSVDTTPYPRHAIDGVYRLRQEP